MYKHLTRTVMRLAVNLRQTMSVFSYCGAMRRRMDGETGCWPTWTGIFCRSSTLMVTNIPWRR